MHVSTAYVAGDRVGVISEHDGDVGQTFRNTYEQTKLKAEQLVTDSGLPAAIVRPSVIVGDSATGWTQAFNVIYWPLQAFARGLFPTVPGTRPRRWTSCRSTRSPTRCSSCCADPCAAARFTRRGRRGASNAELATMAAEAFDAEPPVFVALGEDEDAENLAGALVPYFSGAARSTRAAPESCSGRRRPAARIFPVADALRPRGALGQSPRCGGDVGMQQRAA